ncbi:unnamed protein product, partial [Allacma fusca]
LNNHFIPTCSTAPKRHVQLKDKSPVIPLPVPIRKMLSEEQAAKFIEEKLLIPEWREEIKKSKFNFLVKLENRYLEKMHYENISWGAKTLEELKPPSKEEVIYQCLETGGGACIQLNYFLRLLLEVLGYDVFNVGCKTMTVEDDTAHMIVIIRMPKTEEGVVSSPENKTDHVLYMSDPGFARPAPGLINLDLLPHTYQSGGFTVQHRFNDELQRYERYLIGGDPIKGKFSSPDETYWESCFQTVPYKFEDFDRCMTSIFNDPKFSFFLNTTFLFRHLSVRDINNVEYVSIRGRTVTTGNSSGLESFKCETYDELIPHIEKYFPNLNRDNIRKAVANYKIRQELKYQTEIL